MSAHYNHGNFNGLNPFDVGPLDLTSIDFSNYCPTAGDPNATPFPSPPHGNGTAGQSYNGESNQSSRLARDSFIPHQDDLLQSPVLAGLLNSAHSSFIHHQDDSFQPPALADPSNFSSSIQAVSGSPGRGASTEPSSPTSPRQALSGRAKRLFDSLPEHVQKSVGCNRQLNRMLTEHPHFIPTFNFDSAMSMTARDVVNPVSGPAPPAAIDDDEQLVAVRNQYGIDFHTITVNELAGMGHEFLDMLAQHPKIADILAQYCYEPTVQPETISTILPNVGTALNKDPELLDWYQVPLRKGEDNLPTLGEGDEGEEGEEDEDPNDDDEEEEEEEGEEQQEGTNTKGKGKGKAKGDSKYLPRKVQYAPYRYMFKSAEEARAYRKKVRHPAKIARDIDRVEEYGRYYWTKRIYEAMINVDLIFDNKGSTIATNFSKLHHFKEEDLEATAHHIFDACISIHRRGWHGYDYNRKNYKRGKLMDIFPGSIEGRLERICGLLKHSKAIANDCILGGDLLLQTVDNPIHRASTKTANNKGNIDRAWRLRKQETDRQREKRLAREAAVSERAEARAAEKQRKDAEKQAEKDRKEAEKQAEKHRKEAEKQAEKQRKDAEKQAEKERKQAATTAARKHRGA